MTSGAPVPWCPGSHQSWRFTRSLMTRTLPSQKGCSTEGVGSWGASRTAGVPAGARRREGRLSSARPVGREPQPLPGKVCRGRLVWLNIVSTQAPPGLHRSASAVAPAQIPRGLVHRLRPVARSLRIALGFTYPLVRCARLGALPAFRVARYVHDVVAPVQDRQPAPPTCSRRSPRKYAPVFVRHRAIAEPWLM